MTIQRLTTSVNNKLAGELLDVNELTLHIDAAIDRINARLNTKFPVLSDLRAADPAVTEYTAIPDKYLRTVVIPGAAFYFYTTDEEGADVAPKYEAEFLENLFYMERDYLALVPEEYLEDTTQGTFVFTDTDNNFIADRGLEIDGAVFRI